MGFAVIIFGEESGITRRIVETDRFEELAPHLTNLQPGEAKLVVVVEEEGRVADGLPMTTRNGAESILVNGYPDLSACAALIEKKRGKPAESNRVVVIDGKTGEIDAAIMADPTIDKIEGKSLFQHPDADIGWTLDAKGEFVEPLKADAEIDRESTDRTAESNLDKAASKDGG